MAKYLPTELAAARVKVWARVEARIRARVGMEVGKIARISVEVPLPCVEIPLPSVQTILASLFLAIGGKFRWGLWQARGPAIAPAE